jgi:hypothetical protein
VLLEELREDEDAHPGELGAQRQRCAQPVVGEVRRHLHVDDGDVGSVLAHRIEQRLGVRDLLDDDESQVAQQPHEPLAQQRLVFRHHDAQGHPEIVSPWG